MDSWIVRRHQRYNIENDLFSKLIIKFTRKYYRNLFTSHPDKKFLSKSFWGGDGGFAHAKSQFRRGHAEWIDIYGDFYDAVIEEIRPKKRVLEIGCSMGQWVKRLKLDEIDVDYLGLDINSQSIDCAQRTYSTNNNIKFLCIDVNDGFDLYDYDLIMLAQVLMFLDYDLIERVFSTIKSGAVVVICEPVSLENSSVSEPLSCKTSVGYSHDYLYLLEKTGFNIKSMCESKGNKVDRRITIKAIKV